jgi:hypothetical protein
LLLLLLRRPLVGGRAGLAHTLRGYTLRGHVLRRVTLHMMRRHTRDTGRGTMHIWHPGRRVRHSRGKTTSFKLCSQDLGRDRWETIGERDVLRVAHVGRWISQVWVHSLRHWRWLIAKVAHLHLCLHFIQTHHFASGRHAWQGDGLGLLLGDSPNARLRLQVGNESGVGIFLVTATLGECRLRLRIGLNMLTGD